MFSNGNSNNMKFGRDTNKIWLIIISVKIKTHIFSNNLFLANSGYFLTLFLNLYANFKYQ